MVLQCALGPSLEAVGFKQLQWPGHGVSDTQPYQYLDREYMKADEYDEFLFDPTGYYLSKYLPRVAGAFEGLDELPYLPGLHYLRMLSGIIPRFHQSPHSRIHGEGDQGGGRGEAS